LKPRNGLASRNVSGDDFLRVGGSNAAILDLIGHDHYGRALLAQVETFAFFDDQLIAVMPFSGFVKGSGDFLTTSLGAFLALGANEDFYFFAHRD